MNDGLYQPSSIGAFALFLETRKWMCMRSYIMHCERNDHIIFIAID